MFLNFARTKHASAVRAAGLAIAGVTVMAVSSVPVAAAVSDASTSDSRTAQRSGPVLPQSVLNRAAGERLTGGDLMKVARKGRRGAGRGFRGRGRGIRGGRGLRGRALRRGRGFRGPRFGRRFYGGRRFYRRRRSGVGIAAGIAGLLIGGAIAASKRDYGDRWERCDRRYRTFRWSDGTYIPYVGSDRVLCPYLRR